jgi:two-component system, cell cycle response regulator
MSDKGHPSADTTDANIKLEALITPKLEPGKACLLTIRGRSVGQLLELNELPVTVGRAPDAGLLIDDVAVSRRHARVWKGPDGFTIEDLGSTNGVFVNGVRETRRVLRNGDRIQIGTTTVLKFCFQDEMETSFQKSLYDSATRDGLTGLYNRRIFIETLQVDFSYSYRNDTPLSLLLLDLDHFKLVNDSHGHLAGDWVLKETAAIIQRGLRTEDVAGRHGGEEFAVLLRYTSGPGAYIIAERIRRGIEERRFEHEGRAIRVTTSIGVATLGGRCYDTWEQMIEAADSHLYKAKQLGRNRTHCAGLENTARSTRDTIRLGPEEVRAQLESREGSEARPQAGSPAGRAGRMPSRGRRPSVRQASKRPASQG